MGGRGKGGGGCHVPPVSLCWCAGLRRHRMAKDLMAKADEAPMAFGVPFVDANGHWQLARQGVNTEEVDNITQSRMGEGG